MIGRGEAACADNPRGRSWLPCACLLLLFLAQGCATKRYVGPTSGRSADLQRAISAALDNIVRGFSFSPHAGRSCLVEVVSLAENFGGTSPENELIGALFSEQLARDGIRTMPDSSKADLHMIVRVRTVGVNVVRRDLPFLFYRESTRAVVDLRITLLSVPDGKILEQRDATRNYVLAQTYWLYIIGPFESKEWK